MKSEIILQNVCLDFPVYDVESLSFRNKISKVGKEVLNQSFKTNTNGRIIEGLKNINYNFNHGDRVAILGPNGSGKTTLLKLLAGIYSPTSGIFSKTGKTSCMIDIGFGFEQDATGYENIILSNITRGLTKSEIENFLPDIAEFSGLGEFLDMPFRTYSSGMQARLAFSSAIATTPGILLIDEFFSTGDIDFSKKSKRKVLEMMDNSSILVFASHDLELLNTICNKAICMKNGEIIFSGNTKDAINHYREIYDK
ncbi:MAG: ABC transporter ATP-binding protein [Gammaproteobacteria bacterium]|nr:ABC transporter ATP-binding protein [Gammaproteobacteria bacterium]